MKTTLFIVTTVVISFLLSCQTKTDKNSNQKENQQKMTDQESSKDSRELIPLHEAAFSGSLETVKMHISRNEDLNTPNQDGHTPLMLASFNGHTNVVRILLQNGADINIPDNKGLTPLHFAASGAFPKTVELLLKNGAAINATDQIEHFTPLMYAAAEGNIEVVKILLEKNADLSLTDDDGDDAEAFARQNNHPEIVKILQNQKNK